MCKAGVSLPWEESQDYIRSGYRSPDEFKEGSLRTIIISAEEGIKAIIGKPKGKDTMEIQSYLFDKSKGWTLEKADEATIQKFERAIKSRSEEGAWLFYSGKGDIKPVTLDQDIFVGWLIGVALNIPFSVAWYQNYEDLSKFFT